MFYLTMKREELQEVIDNAVDRNRDHSVYPGGRLSEREAFLLRQVPRRIPYVAFGSWYLANEAQCGCPAVEAGLTDRHGHAKSRGVDNFASSFDSNMSSYCRDRGVTVKDSDGYDETPSQGIILIEGNYVRRD